METATKQQRETNIKNSVGDFQLADTSNGEMLVQLADGKIRWVVETGKWLVWNEKKGWIQDSGEKLMNLTKAVLIRIINEAHEGEEVNQKMMKHAAKSAEVPRRKAMVISAGFEHGVFSKMDQWDSDPWAINVKNGIVDGKTQTFRPRTMDDLCTHQANVIYDVESECPIWVRCVNEWVCGDPELALYLQVRAGLALVTYQNLQIFWFDEGTGQNGKDSFYRVLQHILGSYHKYVAFDTFSERKYGHSEHRNDLATLAGALRLVTSAEGSESHVWDDGIVKQVTGQTDVTCRHIRQEPFTYTPQWNLWVMSNHQPVVKNDDPALWRRLRRLPWNYVVPEDKRDDRLHEKLIEEASGVFNWALAGLKWFVDNGYKMPPCKAVDEATKEYRSEMDLLGRFGQERLTFKPNAEAMGGTIYEEYKRWCGENGLFAMTSFSFHRQFKKRFGTQVRWRDKAKGISYMGVQCGDAPLPEEVL